LIGKQSLDAMSVCYRNAWDSRHPDEAGHTFRSRFTFQVSESIRVACSR
jgi:hypothetical protein